eukprot:UN31568
MRDSLSLPEYLRAVEKIINNESELVLNCFHKSTLPKVLKYLNKVLLLDHEEHLLKRDTYGCSRLLRDRSKPELSLLFRLYNDAGGLEPIAVYYQNNILSLGENLLQNAEQETDLSLYIERLIYLHVDQLNLLQECFDNHKSFHKALTQAFEDIVNRKIKEYTFQEILSTYCDYILRKGGKQQSEEALLKTQDQILQLFSYVRDKDIFAEVYRNSLLVVY